MKLHLDWALAVVLAASPMMLAQDQQLSPEAGEQQALRESLSEAGSSKVDFLRAIERHLEKYPKSSQRWEIERAAFQAAAEIRDAKRVVLYGEKILERDSHNVEALERVSRYLLNDLSKEAATKALEYARRLETAMKAQPKPQAGSQNAGRLAEEQNILLSKAYVYQARAQGNLGKLPEAESLAKQSYDTFPAAEAARELAKWLERMGKVEDAVQALAEAFTVPDPNVDEADRAKDRARMGEWYRKAKGSETGLGDIVLAAYDRSSAKIEAYKQSLRALDPNAGRTDLMDYALTGLKGDKLQMSSLKGKVIVLDFWATWCGPCRAQQPLYEQVKERFKSNPNVVFLNINTDQNREVVAPFLASNKWNKTVYFEDGLAVLLRVTSIPMTLIVNRQGQIASRMNGYIADRFVDMLSERIEESLKEN